eukprot:SAG31_NODE_9882_length_1216_cov_2.336616_2_plen_64_part_00
MLTLADGRIAEQGLGDRVSRAVMDLNDFGPVGDEHKPGKDCYFLDFMGLFLLNLPCTHREIRG